MNSNKRQGNAFERELCEMLAARGFWAHNFAQNKDGQPADIIAVKGNYSCLIDCKLVSAKGFPFSRWEENQRLSMSAFHRATGYQCWLALKLPDDEIRMLQAVTILGLESKGETALAMSKIYRYTESFDELMGCEFEANRRLKPWTLS